MNLKSQVLVGDITYKEEVPIDPMRFELYTLNTIIGQDWLIAYKTS